MKKAIIITTILFILSSLCTVGFAVALGTDAIKDYINNETNPIIDFFEGKDFDFDIDADAEKFAHGDFLNGNDFGIIGKEEYYIGGGSDSAIDVSEKDEIRIHADVASVVVKTGETEAMFAGYGVYSKKGTADVGEYEFLLDEQGYDVYLKSDKHITDSVCELVIEIPKSYEGKVTVDCDVGNVNIHEISSQENAVKAFDMDVKVGVGNITAKNSTVNSADFKVDTGNIEISSDFNCINSGMFLKTETGSVEYTLPQNRFVDVIYNINLGSAETGDIENVEGITVTKTEQPDIDNTGASGNVKGSSGTTAVSYMLGVTIEVGIGSIEFKLS